MMKMKIWNPSIKLLKAVCNSVLISPVLLTLLLLKLSEILMYMWNSKLIPLDITFIILFTKWLNLTIIMLVCRMKLLFPLGMNREELFTTSDLLLLLIVLCLLLELAWVRLALLEDSCLKKSILKEDRPLCLNLKRIMLENIWELKLLMLKKTKKFPKVTKFKLKTVMMVIILWFMLDVLLLELFWLFLWALCLYAIKLKWLNKLLIWFLLLKIMLINNNKEENYPFNKNWSLKKEHLEKLLMLMLNERIGIEFIFIKITKIKKIKNIFI